MIILAIDPGTFESGWCVFDTEKYLPVKFGVAKNDELLGRLRIVAADAVVLEQAQAHGKPVGKTVLETIFWAGQFWEAVRQKKRGRLYASAVKHFLCPRTMGPTRAQTNRALIDLFPMTGGGARPQIGIKKKPGPLYGMTNHVWSALSLAVTYHAYLKSKGEAE
jgi:hypothetical protein